MTRDEGCAGEQERDVRRSGVQAGVHCAGCRVRGQADYCSPGFGCIVVCNASWAFFDGQMSCIQRFVVQMLAKSPVERRYMYWFSASQRLWWQWTFVHARVVEAAC